MRPVLLLAFAGCSTMSLRIGGVVTGDRPAFVASIECGASVGTRHAFALTHEHGVQADEHAAYVGALNFDYIAADPDGAPVARMGPRIRFSGESAAVMMRGGFFTGIGREAKTRSGGLGVEIAGGFDPHEMERVFEASVIMHGRWSID